ncbi:MAG: hypothetical protein ABWX76_13040, partial [Leifsonia flava]
MTGTRDRPDRTESARTTLGTSQLGTSLAIAGGVIMFTALARYLLHLGDYPEPVITSGAWLLLLTATGVTVFAVRANGYLLGDLGFAVLMLCLGLVVALDILSVWGTTGLHPTAAMGAGGVLLGIVTLRSVWDVAVASIVLGATLTITFLTGPDATTLDAALEVLTTTFAVIPPLIACVIVSSYRRMVLMALDRVLIQSTVMAPAFGVSMLESEELASIDLEVEQLFDDIASGREPLPLEPERAQRAGELSTVLRRHLIAGRRHTWLHHAIAESDF